MKVITEQNKKEIENWLNEFDLPKFSKNIWRDFSDGVLIANILKKLYPKLVEIHNYQPSSSTQLKLNNWITLNRKVLKKLNLTLSNETMQCLAKSIPGYLEKLLFDIMNQWQNNVQNNCSNTENEDKLIEEGDIMTVIVTKQVGDGLVHVPQKMILYSEYEKVLSEYEEQKEIIEKLQQHVTHLENIIKLKAERINYLANHNELLHKQPPFLDELSLNL